MSQSRLDPDSYSVVVLSLSPVEVIEAPAFTRRADKLLAQVDLHALIDHLAKHPLEGDEIPGTGGVRKMRFAAQGRGKSGGARVIYFYFDHANPLYALVIYAKGERGNLSPAERQAVSAIARKIKAMARAKRGEE